MDQPSTQRKRLRGRPVGTGISDHANLALMADMIIADPKLKPTTAAKRVLRVSNEADLRRLQVKWKAESAVLLAAAQARAASPKAVAHAPVHHASPAHVSAPWAFNCQGLEAVPDANALAATLGRIPALDTYFRLTRDLTESPMMKSLRAIQNNPAFKAVQAFENHPAFQLARTLENSPAMKSLLALNERPEVKRMHEIVARLPHNFGQPGKP